MRRFISIFLIIFLILTTIGCRTTVLQETSSAIQSSLPSYNLSESSDSTQTAVCPHTVTNVINYQAPTCTDNGYSGDTLCTVCNMVLEIGTQTTASGHCTEIRNMQDATTSSQGYTGDTYCKICGILISSGQTTPILEEVIPKGKSKYTTDNGYVYIIDDGVDITEFSMRQQTKYITHNFHNIEMEIFNLCNAEREKAGLTPLVWYEEAYYFAHIRSEEIHLKWDHERPNGTAWHTVYTNADVLLQSCAENLAQQQGGTDVAASIVSAWMRSTSGHRESILNPNFTKVAIAVTYTEDDYTICVAQHFFS